MEFKAKFKVEATQWFKHGDHPEVMRWNATTRDKCFTCPDDDKHTLTFHHGMILIRNELCGVCPGDWIVEYSDGRIGVCPQNDFNQLFERVEP